MGKLSFTGAAEHYIEDLKRRNYSLATIKGYDYQLRLFAEYLEARRIKLHDITLDTILDYQKKINKSKLAKGKSLSENYLISKILVVKRLFLFLYENQKILINPFDGLPQMKMTKSLPKDIMTPGEVNKLLAAPKTETLCGFRDRCIMEVLYSTAIRPGSLAALTIHDPDLRNGLLRVQKTKSRREQIVPLSKVACNYIKEYLRIVRPKLNKKNLDILFLTPQGAAFTTHSLAVMMRRYVRATNIRDCISTYSWRRTCATEMLRGGSSVVHVAELLSHANLATTQIYLRLAPTDLKEALARHPRESLKIKGEPVFEDNPESFYWQYKNDRVWGKN